MSDADLFFGPRSTPDDASEPDPGDGRRGGAGRVALAIVCALALVGVGFAAGRATAPEEEAAVATTDGGGAALAAATTTTSTTGAPTTTVAPPPQDLLSADDQVQLDRVGPVAVGMTLEAASAAAGQEIVGREDSSPGGLDSGCFFASPADGVPAVSFMVLDDVIARIDVGTPGVTTLSGVGVGSTTAQVLEAYGPDRVVVEPHPYDEGGRYLRFVPRQEGGLSLIFETDGTAVTSYRAGDADAVGFVEGCA